MNAEKIEIQCSGKDKRMNPSFPDTALPQFGHLGHRPGGLFGWNGFETDTTAAIGVGLDDVYVSFLVFPGVPDFTTRELVKTPYRGFGNRELCTALMDKLQSISVATHLLLVPVAQSGLAENDRAHPRLVNLD